MVAYHDFHVLLLLFNFRSQFDISFDLVINLNSNIGIRNNLSWLLKWGINQGTSLDS